MYKRFKTRAKKNRAKRLREKVLQFNEANLNCLGNSVRNYTGVVEPLKMLRAFFQETDADCARYEFSLTKIPPAKNIRVALCLSGFLRTYQITGPSFTKSIFDRYDVDVFIYAPKTKGASSHTQKWTNSVSLSSDESLIDESELNKIYQDRIAECVLWDYDETDFRRIIAANNVKPEKEGRSPIRTYSALYQIKKCNELKAAYEKKHEFKYDIVIKTRADMALYSPLNLEILEGIESSVFYPKYTNLHDGTVRRIHAPLMYPYKNVARGELIPCGEAHFNDFINVTNSANADILASCYDMLPEYYKRGVPHNPETLLFYHLVFENRLTTKMADFVTCEIFTEDKVPIYNEVLGWR